MKKEKGPAPPPPSMPNTITTSGQKESVDENPIPAVAAAATAATQSTIVEDSTNKSNQKETNESPTTCTMPEEIPTQPEVSVIVNSLK